MAKKWLLLLLEVDEEKLNAPNAYTDLPNQIGLAVAEANEAVELDALYLLNQKQKKLVKHIADDSAIDYHHYAVTVRGEKCLEDDCEEHPPTNVLNFYDHTSRPQGSPGIN